MDFSSDTSAPAHPAVLSALADINSGMEASYGGDAITQRLRATIKELFQTEDVAVYIDVKHMCVSTRGVKDVSSSTVTTAYSGKFLEDSYRREFLDTVRD